MATIITANWLTNDQPARGYFDIDLSERLLTARMTASTLADDLPVDR